MAGINAVVWNENVHERENADVAALYPHGIHDCIAQSLASDGDIAATTATLQEPEHGLSAERLASVDVLLWWGHAAHGDVDDPIVDRVVESVWAGMGLIVLHSAHFAKPFLRLMGTPCNLAWREAGERERVWVASPHHPIAAGLPRHFELEQEEMYSEPFGIPEPCETVLLSWFAGGEVFRSGVTFRRGAGKIFYFRPGHEMYPTYHDATVGLVLRNAVRWAHNPAPRIADVRAAPNVMPEDAPERIEVQGPRLHKPGEAGFR